MLFSVRYEHLGPTIKGKPAAARCPTTAHGRHSKTIGWGRHGPVAGPPDAGPPDATGARAQQLGRWVRGATPGGWLAGDVRGGEQVDAGPILLSLAGLAGVPFGGDARQVV
eukprot:6004158-Prymnesium_polylepis.1